ncbi:MAG: RsmE family RNA methyltransferase [Clostridia bacterium]|nr:RsmE family RNA methyltransferase [Clostridia bacterium]
MARRFFVKENDFKTDNNILEMWGPEVHHINVLRHKIGDKIKVNNYTIRIIKMNNDTLYGEIIEVDKDTKQNETVKITLYQSYLKSDKMEFVVQKAVELGVKKIVPLITYNCVVKLDNKDKVKKRDRLNKISVEASKQCGRPDIVSVEEIIDIKEKDNFNSQISENDIIIFAYENSSNKLKEVIHNIKKELNKNKNNYKIAIVIGPEGGFDKKDMEIFEKINNINMVSLGERILRAETASLKMLSNLVYELDI